MNLREAQMTTMPWGVHAGIPLELVFANDPTYLTEFLAPRLDTLDVWLREAVELVIAEGRPAEVHDGRQGELFGSDLGEAISNKPTGEKS